jgi:glutaredoxin
MRSFVIALVATALVGGAGFAFSRGLPPASERDPRALASTPREPVAADAGEKHLFYQWTDERGSVRFARSLEEVPAPWRARAGQIEVDASAFTKKARAAQAANADVAEAAHDVTVYTAPWCGWCRKTLAFLDERGVEYVNKNIEADEEFADELEEKTGGRSIPLVEIDGSLIRGYNPGEMAALLE